MIVPRVVLTGGPCAGKTSALSRLRARLQTYGRRVYTTAEASTLMLDGGAFVVGTTAAQQKTYQACVLRVTFALEDALLAFAGAAGDRAVLVCDRGAMDGKAYLPAPLWAELLAETGHDEAALLGRYDAVVHLVTAAEGAEAHYGNDNNPGRYEDAHGARAVDARLRAAWSGHGAQAVVDNATDFDEKMRRVVAAVCDRVGVPGPGRYERKYLVRPAGEPPEACARVAIEQTYLSGERETRLRCCDLDGNRTYTHATKRAEAGRRVEVERAVSRREYEALLAEADPSRRPIRKERRAYPHAGLYFQIDRFVGPLEGLWLMEVEYDDEGREIQTPPFVEVLREVTGQREYLNATLARQGLALASPAPARVD